MIASGPAFSGTLSLPGNVLDGRVVDFGRIKAADYFDLSLRFAVGDHVEIVATVNNLLNRKPPLTGTNIGPATYNSGNTYPSTYDALGRDYGISAKIKF